MATFSPWLTAQRTGMCFYLTSRLLSNLAAVLLFLGTWHSAHSSRILEWKMESSRKLAEEQPFCVQEKTKDYSTWKPVGVCWVILLFETARWTTEGRNRTGSLVLQAAVQVRGWVLFHYITWSSKQTFWSGVQHCRSKSRLAQAFKSLMSDSKITLVLVLV